MVTPGTRFMHGVRDGLVAFAARLARDRRCAVLVCGPDVPGEGEAKVFAEVRLSPAEHHIVWGVDSDLLLLGLLSPAKDLSLVKPGDPRRKCRTWQVTRVSSSQATKRHGVEQCGRVRCTIR